MPDDALEGDGGAGVHRAQAVGVRHRRHLRDHRSVNLKQNVFVNELINVSLGRIFSTPQKRGRLVRSRVTTSSEMAGHFSFSRISPSLFVLATDTQNRMLARSCRRRRRSRFSPVPARRTQIIDGGRRENERSL